MAPASGEGGVEQTINDRIVISGLGLGGSQEPWRGSVTLKAGS
jgi:hypothetical protein